MSNVPPPPGENPPPPPGSYPPPSGDVPPQAPPAQVPPAAPYASNPYAGAPAGARPKQTLSLISFIVGLASVVLLSWIPIIGLLGGAAAVVLGFLGRAREKQAPSWMWIVGLIAGFLAILINLFVTVITIITWISIASYDYGYTY